MEHIIKSFWVDHVKAARSSGLSLAQYARDHGVPLKPLYAWRSKFKVSGLPAAPSGTSNAPVVARRFVAVRVARPLPVEPVCIAAAARCRLVLAPGMSLELSELPDPNWLIALQRTAQGVR